MKKPTLRKNILREIRSTLNRFLAIFAITALGAGFYAGLRATAPDMIATGDAYFEQQNLADVRLLSTFGFTEEDIDALAAREDVETVMAGYSLDVLVDMADGVDAVRLHTLPARREAGSRAYLNQLVLTEGRYPDAAGECIADSASHYKIGDVITLSAQNDADSMDLLVTRSFTVVGLADSPAYISFTRGNTNIGNGSLSAFLYLDAASFDSEVYLEVYLSLSGSGNLSSQAEGYLDLVGDSVDSLENFGELRARIRYDDIVAEANEELADAKRELAEGRAEADEELADAWATIAEAEKEIADGWAEVEENRQKLQDAEAELADGERVLAANLPKLQNGQTQYEEGLAEYYREYNAAKPALDAAAAQVAQLQGLLDYLHATAAELGALAPAAMGDPAAATQFENLADGGLTAAQQLADAMRAAGYAAEADDLETGIAGIRYLISAGEYEQAAGLFAAIPAGAQGQADAMAAELAAANRQFADAWSELEAGRIQVEDGWAQYNAGVATLASARREIEDGWKELREGEQTLRDAEAELAEGKAEYYEERDKAYAEIADAEAEIAEAEAELADLDEPEWYVYDRTGNPGYEGFGSNIERIDAIATMLPYFFFLVAALVCLTTMTRMVEEERTGIGTFKALGFGKGDIAKKFLIYAGLASFLGGAAGVAIGYFLFPSVIWNAYRMMYIMPSTVFAFQPVLIVQSVLAMMVVTVLTTLGACLGTLRTVPAELMRPKAPKNGTRVLLERIGFVWNRLKFSYKVTARNLFRYKKRFFMTVIGVAGCTALLLTGFGLYDSISGIVDKQYGSVAYYDMIVQLNDASDSGADSDINTLLDELGTYAYLGEVVVDAEGPSGGSGGIITYLNVIEDQNDFAGVLSLHERRSGKAVGFPESGSVVLTEKLATRLGVSAGDTVQFGRSGERTVEARVSGVTENYVYNYIYISADTYETLFSEAPEFNRVYVKLEGTLSESETLSRVVDTDNVVGAVGMSEMREEFLTMLESLNSVVWVIILCAGLLAFVVLYNLTNINITERQREIATLKVLGFYEREVASYVYRENVVLTLIGTLVGLGLGVFLHQYIIVTAEIDEVMFGRVIAPLSYLFSVLFTLACGMLVNLVMLKKLKKIDMVESLKSAE